MLIIIYLSAQQKTCSCCGEKKIILSNKRCGTILIAYALIIILNDFWILDEGFPKGEILWILIGVFYILKKDDEKCLACKFKLKG
jgi:hypothetical protein